LVLRIGNRTVYFHCRGVPVPCGPGAIVLVQLIHSLPMREHRGILCNVVFCDVMMRVQKHWQGSTNEKCECPHHHREAPLLLSFLLPRLAIARHKPPYNVPKHRSWIKRVFTAKNS
jgi:hypothetical protein